MTVRWQWGEALDDLERVVARGGVIAVPTESSYGLGVDPELAAAVESVYEIKGRPKEKALPIIIGDLDQLDLLGVDSESSPVRRLVQLWPAPLSAVLPCRADLPAAAGAGTVAVRMPAHEGLRRLLAALGRPLTATSANRSGRPDVRDPDELSSLLHGYDAVIVDDGVLPGGPPSTLVAWEGDRWRLVRPGSFPFGALESRGVEVSGEVA